MKTSGQVLLWVGAGLVFACGSAGNGGGSAGSGGADSGAGGASHGGVGGSSAGTSARGGEGESAGSGATAGRGEGGVGGDDGAAGSPSNAGVGAQSDAGASDGGAPSDSGGTTNGGTQNGGGSNGGAVNGGAANGGAANGGAANGGAANGGAPQAGAGGAPGDPIASVLTRSYDNQRSNANLAEKTLTVSNVNAAQFGKVFDLPVDDEVYAQILYVPNLAIAGGTHHVIYVATVNNTVYAFDAEVPGVPLWQHNFNGAGLPTQRADVGQACGQYSDYSGNIGIVSTPVVDAATHTMYVSTRTVEAGVTLPRLHALDITTGIDLPNSPVLMQAAVKNLAQQDVVFEPTIQNQRTSLALSGGAVYVGFSAFCDTGNYHGWLLAYDAASLAQLGAFNDTPDGVHAGIWQAGAAPAFDPAGNLYAMTGNGTFDGITNFGESVLKLAPKQLAVLDYFAPANYAALNNTDQDLGSAGPTWLPSVSLLVGGGKEGKLYLMDPANMGHSAAADATVLQSFQGVDPTVRPMATHHIHNGLATWQSPAGLNLYLAGENDYLRAFRFNTAQRKFDLPSALTSSVLPPVGMPGGMLTISANGAQSGTGIVWVTTPRLGDANQAVVPGILRAYNAETLALLWESTSPLDETLDFAKFSNPTVANGKVYAASFSRSVSVYGLRSAAPTNLALNQVASGSAPCAASEGPEKAVNGSVILGNGDKWCSLAGNKFLQVDLGASLAIQRIVLRHANAGGEQFLQNTRDFSVQVSADGLAFDTVATVTGNRDSITTHTFPTQSARYVRVNVTLPTQTADGAARIYELEVYAP